jgi:Xaa-Pro aminopeptidase
MNDTGNAPASHGEIAQRLTRLRKELARRGLNGFIVPHADEHQSEYLPAAAERLAWLTGFGGSAGTAIVLATEAAIFVDGRYTLQVRQQTDTSLFAPEHVSENPPTKWLAEHAKAGDRIGYSPWLMTVAEVRRYAEACTSAGATLVGEPENPVDAIWLERPPSPLGAVSLQPVELSGEEAASKLSRLRSTISEKRADAAVLTQADSIAWTFNLRGTDISHNPVALAFAILPANGKPELFIDGRKLSNTVRDSLSELADIGEPAAFLPKLAELGRAKARLLVDPASTAAAVASEVTQAGGTVVEGPDPTVLPKARKNPIELAGTRRAHIRDGAAMVRFLAWLDGTAPSGGLDEISAAAKLQQLRAETAQLDGSELIDISFDTISGAGPNGAIVHYRVTPASARPIAANMLYLIDSGAQYRDGTTDVTRTVPIGTPTAEQRDRFTRVLKGMLAVANARFPVAATGAQIDTLARQWLWQAGLDYDHGTGHGVGVFLSVHEGPARISKLGTVPLEPGMILSDEPGYYKTGEYGIRIENLIVVTPPEDIAGGDRPMLGFENLTWVPIDRRMIEVPLLTDSERRWIDGYHAALPGKLGHLLDAAERSWLAEATRKL